MFFNILIPIPLSCLVNKSSSTFSSPNSSPTSENACRRDTDRDSGRHQCSAGDAGHVVKVKAPKVKKAPTAIKKPAAHPSYLEMISEATTSLKERTGLIQIAIAKFIEDKHKAHLPANFKKMLLVQLRKCTAAGKLTKVKNSYKISAVAKPVAAVKKPAAAKPKPKSAAAKPKKATVKPKAKPAAMKSKGKPATPKAKTKTVAKSKIAAPKHKAAGRPAKAAKSSVKAAPGKKPVVAAAAVKKAKTVKIVKKAK